MLGLQNECQKIVYRIHPSFGYVYLTPIGLFLVLIIENLKVELLADHNMDDPTLPDDPELVVLYGQLLYITHVTLLKDQKLKIKADCEALLIGPVLQGCKRRCFSETSMVHQHRSNANGQYLNHSMCSWACLYLWNTKQMGHP